mmetsp:Transcript_8711/g.29811  ORF Transcript_8711/g.29811 Transcript_8711/m.29811 type:complete len:87 (-) Transcript_8711:76-336(-)
MRWHSVEQYLRGRIARERAATDPSVRRDALRCTARAVQQGLRSSAANRAGESEPERFRPSLLFLVLDLFFAPGRVVFWHGRDLLQL